MSFHAQGGRAFCEECANLYCNHCAKPLTLAEKRIPLYTQWDNQVRKFRLCLACYRIHLEKRQAKMVKEFAFQQEFQICRKCGDMNDSRDENGWVNSRFCQKCQGKMSNERQLAGDAAYMKEKRPQNKDAPRVVFDRVTGFRQTDKK